LTLRMKIAGPRARERERARCVKNDKRAAKR
jgi:hypothetical protein